MVAVIIGGLSCYVMLAKLRRSCKNPGWAPVFTAKMQRTPRAREKAFTTEDAESTEESTALREDRSVFTAKTQRTRRHAKRHSPHKDAESTEGAWWSADSAESEDVELENIEASRCWL
jgi:hypothetical protein